MGQGTFGIMGIYMDNCGRGESRRLSVGAARFLSETADSTAYT